MKQVKSLKSKDAVRVMSAERWLKTGKPTRAVRALQRLSQCAWQHPLTEAVVWRAAHALD